MPRIHIRIRTIELIDFTQRAPTSSAPSFPTTMVEDKYIGLALAVSGSVAIGTSFIITKKVSSTSTSLLYNLLLRLPYL